MEGSKNTLPPACDTTFYTESPVTSRGVCSRRPVRETFRKTMKFPCCVLHLETIQLYMRCSLTTTTLGSWLSPIQSLRDMLEKYQLMIARGMYIFPRPPVEVYIVRSSSRRRFYAPKVWSLHICPRPQITLCILERKTRILEFRRNWFGAGGACI